MIKIGDIFTRLTTQRQVGKSSWFCLCTCGNSTTVISSKLLTKHVQSCGCLGKEKLLLRETHGKSRSKEYRIWASMLQRCRNPKDRKYALYGGRGITYDPRWESFENFLEDMGECPEGLSLDREDVNGNYTKNNCRWATASIQNFNQNKRKNNTSGRTGVDLSKSGKYRARISYQGKEIGLGEFPTFEEAIKAREDAEMKYFGNIKE